MKACHLPPKTFVTQRLDLLAAEPSDAVQLFSGYTSNVEASKYLQRRPHECLEETRTFIEAWGAGNWGNGPGFAWIISPRGTRAAQGLFLLIDRFPTAEIHFGLSPAYWRKGYMTEAGKAMLDWVVQGSEFSQVDTFCDAEHVAVQALLQRLGFKPQVLLERHLLLPMLGPAKRDCWWYTWVKPGQCVTP